MEAALDAGAEDVRREDDQFVVTHRARRRARRAQRAGGQGHCPWPRAKSRGSRRPPSRVEGKTAESLVKLLEEIEELDDVQKVDANFDMDLADLASA